MPNPEGYRKALRLMKMAEKFNKPIVTLIDTPGAYPGLEAEERGQGEAIARNLLEMAQLKVPVICIVIGEGASGGALLVERTSHVTSATAHTRVSKPTVHIVPRRGAGCGSAVAPSLPESDSSLSSCNATFKSGMA